MTKPTLDEVEWIRLQASVWLDDYDRDLLLRLCGAYVLQEKEVELLRAENQALREIDETIVPGLQAGKGLR